MLLFLWCYCVKCHFKIREISNKEMSHVIAQDKSPWLVFAVNRSDDKAWGKARDIAYAFKKSDHIVFYDQASAIHAQSFSGVSGPALYFFNSSVFVASFKLPSKKKLLTKMVQQLLNGEEVVIETKEELKKQLKDANFAVLTTQSQLHHGKFVWFEFGKHVKDIQLLLLSDDIFDGIPGIDHSQLAIYRLSDKQYESFDRTTMFYVLKSRVREFSAADLEQEDGTMIVVTADAMTDEQRKMFRHLSNEFKTYQFGTLSEGLLKIAALGFGQDFDLKKPIHVFSYKHRYSYQSADISTVTEESLKQLLTDIENGKRMRTYVSEPKENAKAGIVETIVGVTYKDFVNQNADTLVLFSSNDCPSCTDALKVLQEFEQKCMNSNLNVKSAVINVDLNSEEFPWIPSTPYLVLFPMRNRTDFQPIRGKITMNSLTLLLETYGSQSEMPFHGTIPTRADFQDDLARVTPTLEHMPEDDRRKYYEWMFQMSKEVEQAHASSTDKTDDL